LLDRKETPWRPSGRHKIDTSVVLLGQRVDNLLHVLTVMNIRDLGAPSVTGLNSSNYEGKASSRNTTKDGMTAVIGPFRSVDFRLPCVYKMMTTLPVTMDLMLLLSAVTGKRSTEANHMR